MNEVPKEEQASTEKQLDKMIDDALEAGTVGEPPQMPNLPAHDAQPGELTLPELPQGDVAAANDGEQPQPTQPEQPTQMFAAAPQPEPNQGEQQQIAQLEQSAQTFTQQNPNASFTELSQAETTVADDIRIIRDKVLELVDKLSEVFG